MNGKYPLIAAFTGVLGFSLKSILIKLAYTNGLQPVVIMGLRMLLSLPFFVLAYCFSKYFHRNYPITSDVKYSKAKRVIGIFICACLYYISSLSDIIGLNHTTVNIERIILFTIPVFVVILSRVFNKKKYKAEIYIYILISWLGIIIAFIGNKKTNSINADGYGFFLILISAISYAAYFIISEKVMSITNFFTFNAQVMGIASLFSLIPFIIEYNITDINTFTFTMFKYPFLLAVMSTVIPSFLMMYAIKICGPERVAVINNMGPFITMLIGYVALNEIITLPDFIGMAVVMLSVILINKSRIQKRG